MRVIQFWNLGGERDEEEDEDGKRGICESFLESWWVLTMTLAWLTEWLFM